MEPLGSIRGRPLWRPAAFFFLASAASLFADDYAESLVARARDLDLAGQPEWRTLLHYRRSLTGWKSLVDDPRFFLSRDGKRNPASELESDLRAFFAPPGTNEFEHAICRFPARFEWLQRQLGIEESKLPVGRCEPYERTMGVIKPESIALAYPAAFMNGPASMFGHTLIVVDGEGRNRLLSRAISYAARTRPTIGPIFAFAGIFGFYPGYYAYQSYFEKTQQYGDIGHRDVWEYELNLTPEEVNRLLRHAWELQNIYSWYYFFDENCAYNILYLFDVARPSLKLTRRMPWFVIPIDTVRWVEKAGLVKAVSYRPSPVTEIKHRAARMTPQQVDQALALTAGRIGPDSIPAEEPVEARRDVLDLSTDYLKYQLAEKRLDRETYSPRLLKILSARSALGKAPPLDIATPVRPDYGHRPMRIGVAAGAAQGDPFGEFRWRLANHALEDPDDGFTRGAQIQFLNTQVRWTEGDARLMRLDLVDVFSVAPRDRFFTPSSWKVRIGFERDPIDRNAWMGLVNTGAGYAKDFDRLGLCWAFVEAEAGWRESFEDEYEVALGPAVGLMQQIGPNWKHLLQARAVYAGLTEDKWLWNVSWVQDIRLRRDMGIGLEARWDDVDGQTRATVSASFNTYW